MDLEPRTRTLLSLAYPAGLLQNAFDKQVLKRQRALFDMVLEREPVGRAVKEAIEAEAAAAAVAATCGAVAVM